MEKVVKVGLNDTQGHCNLARFSPGGGAGHDPPAMKPPNTRKLFMQSAPLMLGLRLLPALIPTGAGANLAAGSPVRRHLMELREVQLTPVGAADAPSFRPVSSPTAATH